jgi:HD-GYP domain-containing protein (c-di-GMP phosphodiesterase class II)
LALLGRPPATFLEFPAGGVLNFTSNPGSSASITLGSALLLRGPDPWDVLDRFLHELQETDRSARQFRFLLTAIADSIHADTVFLVSLANREVVEVSGRQPMPAAWCRDFALQVLRTIPEGTVKALRSDFGPCTLTPVPHSMATVQVSKGKNAWAVALCFSLDRLFQTVDLKIMMLARRMLINHFHQLQAVDRLKESLIGVIHCLTAAVDAKDPYTCGHSERVARIAVRLGQQMGLPETTISDIYLAGLLHDVGKIGIKDSVLQKAGKLTEEEMRHVQEHPVIGDRIMASVQQLAHLRPGVRNHHEWWNGTGYPDRLSAAAIPQLARILAVADACDAMTSPRPYRPAMPTSQIEAIMAQGAGSQWDPNVVDHFLACRQELYPICQRGIGESILVAVDHAVRASNKLSGDTAMNL